MDPLFMPDLPQPGLQPQSEAHLHPQPESQPQTDMHPQSGLHPQLESQPHPQPESQLHPVTHPQPDSQLHPDTRPQPDFQLQPQTRQHPQPEPQLTRPDVLFGMHNTEVSSAIAALLYSPREDLQPILEYLSLNRVLMGSGAFSISVSRIFARDSGTPYADVLQACRAFAEAIEEQLLRRAVFYMAQVRGLVVCIMAIPHHSGEQAHLEQLHSMLTGACEDASGRYGRDARFGAVTAVSPVFQGVELIPATFERTVDLLQFHCYFGGEEGVVTPGGPNSAPTWYLHSVAELENHCRVQCSLLMAGKMDRFSQNLREAITDLQNGVPGSLQQFKTDCFQYVSLLLAQLLEHKVFGEEQLRQVDIFGLIAHSESAEELYNLLKQLLQNLTAPYFRQLEDAAFASAGNMRRYIQTHYTDANLTVGAAAEAFHMSQPAFSAYYIRKFGVSPLEEINHCRVRRAHDLIMAGETSMEQIMQESGFVSASTMHRLFLKYYDTTPARLRRNLHAAPPEL